MSNIAIITARGGSKRILRKNIKPFCGKPIISYSIEAALESKLFETVMVSTDDEEIAAIARKSGAEVPFLRSSATADDYATTSDVLLEVLQQYELCGQAFSVACCLYPTAPFVSAEKLQQAVMTLLSYDADTVMPFVMYSFPPQRAGVIRDGRFVVLHPEYLNSRSQDLEPVYHDCGQFYVFNVERFRKSGRLLGDLVIPIVVNPMEAQDIDQMEDWEIAEMKYELIRKRKETET